MLAVSSNIRQSRKQILIQNQNIDQTYTDNSDTTINDNTFVNEIKESDNSSIITEQITPEISNKKGSIREQFKTSF